MKAWELLKFSLHTYIFCYYSNHREDARNYEYVSSAYSSLLFSLIFWAHLSIISLKFGIKSNSFDFIRELRGVYIGKNIPAKYRPLLSEISPYKRIQNLSKNQNLFMYK